MSEHREQYQPPHLRGLEKTLSRVPPEVAAQIKKLETDQLMHPGIPRTTLLLASASHNF